jgi:radical SAM protein with 4Fe4S-binding SPASM domain
LIKISLFGAEEKTHDDWTQVKNSFKQTIKGIKNLKKYFNNIGINFLVHNKSYNTIPKLVKLCKDLDIKKLFLFNIVPLGRAKKKYFNFCVPLQNFKNFPNPIINNLSYFKLIDLEDFPLCIFNQKLFAYPKIVHYIQTSGNIFKEKNNIISNYSVFSVLNIDRTINNNLELQEQKNLNKIKNNLNNYRIHLKYCKNCLFKSTCQGIFSEYVKHYGYENTNNIIKELYKNNLCP